MAWSSRFLLLVALCGCGDAVPSICDRPATVEPIRYTDGCPDIPEENGCYVSAGWDGTTCGEASGGLLRFSGGAQYVFEHNLDCDPMWTDWEVHLSFERDGVTSGSVAPAAGNQAQLTAIDRNSITILNGSCVEYWMLIRVCCNAPP